MIDCVQKKYVSTYFLDHFLAKYNGPKVCLDVTCLQVSHINTVYELADNYFILSFFCMYVCVWTVKWIVFNEICGQNKRKIAKKHSAFRSPWTCNSSQLSTWADKWHNNTCVECHVFGTSFGLVWPFFQCLLLQH